MCEGVHSQVLESDGCVQVGIEKYTVAHKAKCTRLYIYDKEEAVGHRQ